MVGHRRAMRAAGGCRDLRCHLHEICELKEEVELVQSSTLKPRCHIIIVRRAVACDERFSNVLQRCLSHAAQVGASQSVPRMKLIKETIIKHSAFTVVTGFTDARIDHARRRLIIIHITAPGITAVPLGVSCASQAGLPRRCVKSTCGLARSIALSHAVGVSVMIVGAS